MAVSLTSTVNLIFGSQVLDPETGVILNDEVGYPLCAPRYFPTVSVILDGRFQRPRNTERFRIMAIAL